MPRSYASDLLVDEIDVEGERIGGAPVRTRRRRSDLLMLGIAAVASAAVLFNALAMQEAPRNGRQAAAATPAAEIPRPVSAPAEVRRAAAPEAPAQQPAASVPTPAVTAAPAPRPPAKPAPLPRVAAPAAAPVAPSPASIGSISNDTTGTVRPPADVAVSPRVMEIQKALAKLGYGPIKVDGRGGDATKDAIERFERDRRLPVTGAISDRLVRELNAVAGFSIQ